MFVSVLTQSFWGSGDDGMGRGWGDWRPLTVLRRLGWAERHPDLCEAPVPPTRPTHNASIHPPRLQIVGSALRRARIPAAWGNHASGIMKFAATDAQ